ncbi:MAG: hypothetical protein IVW53_10010 [Chloroflexi bacterium]|nr:hypothetical protein [Chloroflexota bacterium]
MLVRAAVLASPGETAPTADQLAVQQTVVAALDAPTELLIIPSVNADGTVDPEIRVQMEAHAREVLTGLFAGDLLAERLAIAERNIVEVGPDEGLIIGGGVSEVRFISTVIDGDRAAVVVHDRITEVGKAGPSGRTFSPSGTETNTLTLVRTNGRWLVVSEQSTPDSGSQPG